MDIDNAFYDRIVYKKNAFDDLQIDLKVYYPNRNVLLISTKSVSGKYLTEIVNALSFAQCSFKHFIAKNNFSEAELNSVSDILIKENFDLIVVLGGGRACNVAKYFSGIFDLPYMVCPSAPSGVAYFSNICINPYDATRSFVVDYPERIYIQESIIKKSPRILVKQGVSFILGFYEMIASVAVENILFDKNTDTSAFKKVLHKLENELVDILTGNDDSRLVLMDCLIDLANALSKFDVFNLSCFNLYLILQKINNDENCGSGAGELFLISAKLLLSSYQKVFSRKSIKVFELPDFQKVVKNINKYNVFIKKIKNLAFFSEICENKMLLLRVNNLKEEFYFQCSKRHQELNNSLSKINLYETIITKQPTFSSCMEAINVLPFTCENNYIVSLMGGIGLVNCL